MLRQLLPPADDSASRVLADAQTAVTRVKEIITEGGAKGWKEEALTKQLNGAIALECRKIENAELREQMRKALVAAARKWHYELKMTYRVLDENLRRESQRQPLWLDINDLLRKTPYEKAIEFRKVLDDGGNVGIPVIKDYQRGVKLAIKAMSAEPPKIVSGTGRAMPLRLRAEMAVRYSAAVENLQELVNAGVEFCWISSHASCSPRCAPYQGKLYSLNGKSGTKDGIPYRPIADALAGPKGDGNGCISGYNCRHRAIAYEKGSRPPADYSEAEIKREYAIDQQQRKYENQIRQLKTEERQLRAAGMTKEAAAIRKQWRRLTVDYQMYSMEHNRAYYPYRYVIDRAEIDGVSEEGTLVDETIKEYLIEKYAPVPVTTLKDSPAFRAISSAFDLKSNRVIITHRQYERHIATGKNTHDDFYDEIKDFLPEIINDPDYIFESDKKENTAIYISVSHKAQIIVALNVNDAKLSNTVISLFQCGETTLKKRKKKLKMLYKKKDT